MRDGVGERPVVRLLCDGVVGQTGDLRGPGVGNRVARQLNHIELLRERSAVQRDVVGELLHRGGGVGGSQRLMGGLEVDVEVEAGFVAFIFLKNASDDGSRKARLGIDERKCFSGKAVGIGLLGGRIVGDRDLSAPHRHHVGRNRDADGGGEAIQPVAAHRKPAS